MKRKLYIGLMYVLLIVFCVSTTCVVYYEKQSADNRDRYAALAELVQTDETTPNQDQEPNSAPTILAEYAQAYEVNPHLIGWLEIPDSTISYPVVQDPYDEDDYYLDHDFMGNKSSYGCLFVRNDADVLAPSDNVTIYGHHMRDGSMFAGLEAYGKKSYWESHKIIRFDTIYEKHTYEVFAVFTTTATLNKGFAYHSFINGDKEAFDAFVDRCKGLSMYDTGISPQWGDKLICLSTCEYSKENGRLVVAAVRVDN